jgi:hypothetical protein
MTTTKRQDITDYLGEDVGAYVVKRCRLGFTYREIAADIAESGYIVSPLTLQWWAAQERKKEATRWP